jgi:digeranylgeranylglycerophospholipid reductase
MLDRKTWQQDLARQARKLGVAVYENSKITPERLSRMQTDYDWILDASGAPSVTSRIHQFSNEYFREYLLAYQLVLAGDFSALWPRIKVAFFPNMTADYQPAYYWIFPKDAGHANVGAVCTVQGALSQNRLDLKKLLADAMRAEGLMDAVVLEKGGGIGSSRMLPNLVCDNIMLIGDAAGLTSALHGGGIDMACLSGVLAVAAVSEGRKGVDGYTGKLKDYLSERNALEAVTIRKMRRLSFEKFDRLLRGITAKSKSIRLMTGLSHPDMLYTTLKWFGTKKEIPGWPV